MQRVPSVTRWLAVLVGACVYVEPAPVITNPDVPATPALTPDPPGAASFMWQSLQTDFHDESGSHCVGQVTLAVGDRAICYEGADDRLRCAGTIYTVGFGTTFTTVGVDDVDQVLLSPSSNGGQGDGICVHQTEGTAQCMGNSNTHGEFGNGTQLPSTAFAPWGEGTYARIATGTGNEVCAIDMRGNVACAGNGFASTPLVVGTDAHSFWIDTAGAVHLDDANVFRASNGRAECTVEAAGLVCGQVTFGSAGQVIDGTTASSTTEPRLCWLEGNGRAKCGDPGVPPLIGDVFDAAGPILYLSGNIYTGWLCAVAFDGSLWCIGANDSGQLGTGSMESLTVEQQVQPPGSVKIDCQ